MNYLYKKEKKKRAILRMVLLAKLQALDFRSNRDILDRKFETISILNARPKIHEGLHRRCPSLLTPVLILQDIFSLQSQLYGMR